MKRILKFVGGLLLAIVLGAILWLAIKPPELLRVGTGYAAKIICSNVFVAGRDADAVLADDVQAPGNPLLRFLNASLDENDTSVTVRIFSFSHRVLQLIAPRLDARISRNTICVLKFQQARRYRRSRSGSSPIRRCRL